MPWVRLDDRFPSHRKVALLSDRAFRLYVSALCWSSENLTEGKVLDRELALVAHVRSARKAAADLEAAGLWDRVTGGWVIHDYLEYNPDRAKVKSERAANAARQQAWRDRKRAEREAKKAAKEADRNASRNAPRNAVTPNAPTAPPRHDDDTNEGKAHGTFRSSSQVSEVRNGGSNSAPSFASSTSYGSTAKEAASSARDDAFPDPFADLKKSLDAAGLGAVAWDIKKPSDLQRIKSTLDRVGIDLMVRSAVNSARAQGEPATVVAWIGRWQSLSTPKTTHLGRDSPTLPPHCGDSECDPDSRMRPVVIDGLPELTPCPACHPRRQGARP